MNKDTNVFDKILSTETNNVLKEHPSGIYPRNARRIQESIVII